MHFINLNRLGPWLLGTSIGWGVRKWEKNREGKGVFVLTMWLGKVTKGKTN